ncbi:hypothetical protein ACFLUZ_04150, partial [Chloroflexota bacterium]
MIYLLYKNRHFNSQIEYVFKVIFSIFGVGWKIVEPRKLGILPGNSGDILISYSREKPSAHSFHNHIHIYESGLFGRDYLKLDSLPLSPLRK